MKVDPVNARRVPRTTGDYQRVTPDVPGNNSVNPRHLRFGGVSDVIDFDGEQPLYRQLADIVIRRIERGDIPAGRRIPSKRDLVEEYGVGRHTAEKAIGLLVEEGWVRFSTGRGHFVLPR